MLAPGQRDLAQRFGLVAFAVAEEAPDLALARSGEAAVVEIVQKTRLVDGDERAKAHRHRRELPEVWHQPRVRVRRQPTAAGLAAEVVQLLGAEPTLEEGAGVDARRRMALEKDQVAAVVGGRRMPEMRETGLVERHRGLIAGDVAAQLRRIAVGAQNNRHRVPADQRADARLELAVGRVGRLLLGLDRVDVSSGQRLRRPGLLLARELDQFVQQKVGAFGPTVLDHRA